MTSLASQLDALDELFDTIRLLVGSALDNMGTPEVENVNFCCLDLGASLAATTLSASIASVRATFYTSRVPKCTLIRG